MNLYESRLPKEIVEEIAINYSISPNDVLATEEYAHKIILAERWPEIKDSDEHTEFVANCVSGFMTSKFKADENLPCESSCETVKRVYNNWFHSHDVSLI
ncbi:MAG TPA: hypothetical protein PLT65_02850 [Bacilli bacterium]|nr:hypothetical protein [Bacilli bacterium]